MNKIAVYILLGIFVFVLLSNSAVSTLWDPEAKEISFQVNHSDRIIIGTSGFEKKVLIVGDTWEKDGWNLSVKAVDRNGSPGFILVSVSYQGKQLEDARIETGKSYTYNGRNPDGSEVPLLIIKDGSIFVGANTDAVRLEINWSIPGSGVQILEVPVESEQTGTATPVPTPAAQTSPKAPGFGVILSAISLLVVMIRGRKT
ncbi:MAG: hypothetical protein FIB07_01085 [Candidatus Methanoperedens sp.]|nr:hypothetical protein [Candidatus Methanoperedens sp.]